MVEKVFQEKNEAISNPAADKSEDSELLLHRARKQNQNKFFFTFLLLGIAIIIVGLVVKHRDRLSSTFFSSEIRPFQQDVTQSTTKSDVEHKFDGFIKTKIPSPLETVTIYKLPNFKSMKGPVKYGTAVWFTSGTNLIEYSLETNSVVSYSDIGIASCSRGVVSVTSYLYVVCQPEGSITSMHDVILKINPDTREVERVIGTKDAGESDLNYQLYPDGEIIWVTTFDGVAKLDTNTDQLVFFQSKLGLTTVSNATQYNITRILVDADYVWAVNSASAVSRGGITYYEKATGEWHAFGPDQIKDEDFDRLDFDAIKLIPGGVQVAFRDGHIGSADKLVEKRYLPTVGAWEKVGIDRIATGNASTDTLKYLNENYPPRFEKYSQENVQGLSDLVFPHTGEAIEVQGRDNYVISPEFDGKRYILTNATIDQVTESDMYPKILVKLGESLEEQHMHLTGNVKATQGLAFLVEPDTNMAVIMQNVCISAWCVDENIQLFVVDLAEGKLLKKHEFNRPDQFDLDIDLQIQRDNNSLVILTPYDEELLKIDLTTFSYRLIN